MRDERLPVMLTVVGTIVALGATTVTALFSHENGVPYNRLNLVALIIYAAVGFIGGLRHSLAAAAWAGLIVSFLDTSLGLSIEWASGPRDVQMSGAEDVMTTLVAYKIILALDALSVLGGVGAGRWVVRRRAATSSAV